MAHIGYNVSRCESCYKLIYNMYAMFGFEELSYCSNLHSVIYTSHTAT